jgi:hypothetical protein
MSASTDGKRCVWCGRWGTKHSPVFTMDNEKFVHYTCIDDYKQGLRRMATEEDKSRRPYIYSDKSRWA